MVKDCLKWAFSVSVPFLLDLGAFGASLNSARPPLQQGIVEHGVRDVPGYGWSAGTSSMKALLGCRLAATAVKEGQEWCLLQQGAAAAGWVLVG
jgi:hypothetical protein